MAECKEFIVKNFAEIDAILAAIKASFEQESVSNVANVVKFDKDISVDDLKQCLSKLWEYETDSEHTIDILIKNLSYAHRREALRLALKTPNLRNNIFLTNIFCLVKQSNTFEEAYFEHEQVFLNDEVELLDILDDLEVEIAEVTKNLAEYYVSILKTCHLVDAVENNPNAVKLENIYVFLFDCMDATMLAKVLSSVKDPSIWETKKIVIDGLNYLGSIANKFIFTNNILDLIFSMKNGGNKDGVTE